MVRSCCILVNKINVSHILFTIELLFSNSLALMDDSVSSSSSRDSTPCYDSSYNETRREYSSNPITELLHHFDRHTLTPRRPNPRDNLLPRVRDQAQSTHPMNSISARPRQYLQPSNRSHGSSAHLSRLSALVENMVQTGLPTYDPTHPASVLDDSTTSPSLSPDERRSSAVSYFALNSLSPPSTPAVGSYGSTLQHPMKRPDRVYRIEKELRHCTSREGIGGGEQKMVRKKIRMRKSSKNLGRGSGKRPIE